MICRVVKEKSPEERVELLVESVAYQRIDNVGPVALKTMAAMLNNCSKPDPKYRQVKKENAVLKKRVLSVPGALPLLFVVFDMIYDFVECWF